VAGALDLEPLREEAEAGGLDLLLGLGDRRQAAGHEHAVDDDARVRVDRGAQDLEAIEEFSGLRELEVQAGRDDAEAAVGERGEALERARRGREVGEGADGVRRAHQAGQHVAQEPRGGEGLAAGHLDLPAAGQRREDRERALDLRVLRVADAVLAALDAVAAVVVAVPADLPLDGRCVRPRRRGWPVLEDMFVRACPIGQQREPPHGSTRSAVR
jgi:hypothetical protein